MFVKTAISILATVAVSFAEDDSFVLHRITHESLTADHLFTSNESILLDALSTDGLVSLTGIPGFHKTKRGLMSHLHACIMSQDTEIAPKHTFKDGTVRRTLGTITVPGAGARPLAFEEVKGTKLSESCQKFNQNLEAFRDAVDKATTAFAERLTFEMGNSLSVPLMTTKDGSADFDSIKDIVASGEHLEHFHSYQKTESGSVAGKQTIDLHTDQGFFITLSPGLMIAHNDDQTPDLSKPPIESEGFYIETSDGKHSLVKFDGTDDLIFMLGDGVNQYINNNLRQDSTSAQKALRATPHAVSLSTYDDSLARVWYGRMVLPPREAYSTFANSSYGDVRKLLIETPTSVISPGIGCSSMNTRVLADDSQNNKGVCEHGELYCWFRCMKLENFGMDVNTCPDQNLQLQCVNPRGQRSSGTQHGDYFPACTNTTEEVTDYPPIDITKEDECDAVAWKAFSAKADGYTHHFDLTTEKNNGTVFMWSVIGDRIKARLVFNGLFGWLATGFLNTKEGAKHNGMNGANIIMAIPGGNYDAATGLDTSMDTTVKEYVIDKDNSAFRHWTKPVTDSNPNASAKFNGCYTELTFEVDNINGKKFNVTGVDHLLWAGNDADYFVGYHGRGNRARFTVEWSTGVAYMGLEKPEDDVPVNRKPITLVAIIVAGLGLAVIGVGAVLFLKQLKNAAKNEADEKVDGVEKALDEA